MAHRAKQFERTGQADKAERANVEIQDLDFQMFPELAGPQVDEAMQ